ncbi:MAG: phytoene synthase [Rhodobacteraceae bacterium]|nr:MAG: phytoene synthase [Paracoccaceae bacterium]
MSALAEIVRAGDPDRFTATLAAPEAAREKLWTLYAFNLEIARAPYVTQEPLIAEMRLQFWSDVMAEIARGATPRAHEVAQPLAALWQTEGLPIALGKEMISARRWDVAREPFADEAAMVGHLNATAGHLMWLSARLLGASAENEPVVRDMAYASGLANWLVAVPALRAAGRAPLVDESDGPIRALADDGLRRLGQARAERAHLPASVLPALLTGWQAGPILRRAVRSPARVREGRLQSTEFARRGGLLLRALSGRW